MRYNKTQSNKQRAREGDRLTPAPAPALFVLFIGKTTPNAKGAKNKPIQGTKRNEACKHTKHTRKAPQNANNKPTRATKGETMTAEKWETLKQAQRQAIKGGNIADINRINKILFEERERRQKAREQAREQEREKMLSAENEREL